MLHLHGLGLAIEVTDEVVLIVQGLELIVQLNQVTHMQLLQ